MKNRNFAPSTGSFLDQLSGSLNEDLTPTKNYIRQCKLIKKLSVAVREEYDYIRQIIKAPVTTKFSYSKILDDVVLTLCSIEPSEQLEIERRGLTNIELIDLIHSKSKIGYYYY